MKNIEITIFDLFAYVIPGMVLVLEIALSLHLLNLYELPSLTFGDTTVVTALSLFAGILCSALRPNRFVKSATGTTASAYKDALKDDEFVALARKALQFFFGDDLSIDNWTPNKHFSARFLVERNDSSAGKFIRRQSAIRQLRYNTVFPLVAGIILCLVVAVAGVYGSLWPWKPALALAAATVVASALILRAIYISAQGNIVREVNYVFAALISLYCEQRSNQSEQITEDKRE